MEHDNSIHIKIGGTEFYPAKFIENPKAFCSYHAFYKLKEFIESLSGIDASVENKLIEGYRAELDRLYVVESEMIHLKAKNARLTATLEHLKDDKYIGHTHFKHVDVSCREYINEAFRDMSTREKQ